MTVPLDRLYHYIESIAQDIRGDDVIIYRFYPHGAKNLEALVPLKSRDLVTVATCPQIYCYDQEPLNYDMYVNDTSTYSADKLERFKKYNVPLLDYNISIDHHHVYDSHILIHSEKRSANLTKYENDKYFTPVYYWSHGIIARDWFRYAEYVTIKKDIQKTFLIYNRAWSGTREYRLKFIDFLIDYNLVDSCQVTINPIEPELDIHYNNHSFISNKWQPTHCLEDFIINQSLATSSASADYCDDDYIATEFEVVLETLFDDDRLHLTEKILRPIALGQPFLLAATHSSLEYLRSYGFKTFDGIIDEGYDKIEDPVLRLEAIVKAMKEITLWSDRERKEKMKLINQITAHNRTHFFSVVFTNQIVNELITNLSTALDIIESTNTGQRFIARRKELSQYADFKIAILNDRPSLLKILQRAREYYNKH